MEVSVKEMKCFKEIAEVIGEVYAEIELQRVVDHFKGTTCEVKTNKPLLSAFDWRESPQKLVFWLKIWKGEFPKIKVEGLACFEQVEKALGTSRAKRELFIALNKYKGWESNPVTTSAKSLAGLFVWGETPQKGAFWSGVMIDQY